MAGAISQLNHNFVLALASSLSVLCIDSLRICLAALPTSENKIAQIPKSIHALSESDIKGIAKQLTVRILTDIGAGSGVIIRHTDKTYTVLTNQHVIQDTRTRKYSVITSDNVQHQATSLTVKSFKDLDLALLQFTSTKNYKVAAVRNSPLHINEVTYATGFPNWHWQNQKTPITTRQLSFEQAFTFAKGDLQMVLDKPLFKGYQMGYTSDVVDGMSGGPILDQDARLVGVNGRLKEPYYGITTFLFSDGTLPSKSMFYQMNKLSWGIPVASYLNKY
jgi:serine protease Do